MHRFSRDFLRFFKRTVFRKGHGTKARIACDRRVRSGRRWYIPPLYARAAVCYTVRMEQKQLLPLSIQDFSILREGNRLYVDKTALMHRLVTEQRGVFLSRPRRFGKSLLLSTLKYYFLARRDLFHGLAVEGLEAQSATPWTAHPVLYFSLASGEFTKPDGLRTALHDALTDFESAYGLPQAETDVVSRFKGALKHAFEKTGQRVVVLVDEYDNPLLKNMTVHPEQEQQNRELYKAFFAVLKDYDEYLRFYMFTGVTKFSKVSIFSDLNQLTDISLSAKYAEICGITQAELEAQFAPWIAELAASRHFTREECIAELKRMYDGYHFAADSAGMYNPYSLIHAFDDGRLGYYWFESGTPTFLINKLKAAHYDVRTFTDSVKVGESALKDYRPENSDPTPLFYQSGYLTIKDFAVRQRAYTLGFPNAEVKYGFLESLAPSYLHVEDKVAPFNIDLLDDAVESGDTDGIRDWFTALFALLPYPAGADAESVTEQNFQNVIFMTLTMMGKYARTEVHGAKGRADCILEADEYVYVFEFKRDTSADDALAQLAANGYAQPYAADRRTVYCIGVNFSTAERNITEWKAVERS